MNLQLIRASNGVGEPVQATVTALRNIGSTTLSVDALTNWPANFIATTGNKLTNGTLDPTTVMVFSGHTSGANTIIIDSIAPGYADRVSNVGNVVVIKPATMWADNLADTMAVAHNDDGSLKPTAVPQVDWAPLTVVPTLAASNGQREFSLSFAGVDYTSKIQQGTKLKIPRTSTAPTQAMSFTAASSQYASKASPAGITFTSAYTCEAWVYLNSYTGNDQGIISRYDGTNGFILYVTGAGQLTVNAGSTTNQISYQSVPLKRFVHVAATFSAGTMNLYIDGVLVPSTKTGAATSITQAGNLQLGAYNSTKFLDGYISEARIWSVAQTAQQIRDNQNKSLVGNETNLVALFKGNGNFNDSTANANNLTASGGAIATQTFASIGTAPMNAIEYAIVTSKPVYSGGNTTCTVFTPTGTGIPNETLGAVSYSSMRTPFGFPTDFDLLGYVYAKPLLMTTWSGGSTTGVVVNGLQATVNIPTNQTIKLTWNIPQMSNTTDGIRGDMYLIMDGVQVAAWYERTWLIGSGGNAHCLTTELPVSAGSHTFEARIGMASGTMSIYSAPVAPAYLKIERANPS